MSCLRFRHLSKPLDSRTFQKGVFQDKGSVLDVSLFARAHSGTPQISLDVLAQRGEGVCMVLG